MDTVFLHDLKIEAIIGIFDWERKVRQPIVIDLDMAFDISAAAKSRDIKDTLDYKQIADRISEFVKFEKFELVESLAEGVAALVLKEFKVDWLRIRCSKPTVMSNVGSVGVVIERSRA